jgi:hypothetical protein
LEGSTATEKPSKDVQTLSTKTLSGAEKFNEVISFEEPEEIKVFDDSKNHTNVELEQEGTELGRVYSPTINETVN